MRGARTDFLSTAPVAATAAVIVLMAVGAWPLSALVRYAAGTDLLTLVRTDREVRAAIGWGLTQAAISSALGVIFGLACAYCWARLRFPGRTLSRALTSAPLAIPAVALAVGVQALFAPGTPGSAFASFLGVESSELRNGTGAVIVTHTLIATASVGWFASVAWASVDARKVDAARTLGASRLRAARVAVFPAVWPAALAGAEVAFLQSTLSYGAVVILAPGRETIEGLSVRLALSGDERATAIALLTAGYALLVGLIAIQNLRSPTLGPRRTRPPQRARGLDRLVILVAAIPALLVLGVTLAMLSRAVDSGDGFTTTHVRSLITGTHATATREAALGTLLAALPAAALAAAWGGMAGAALGRLDGVTGWIRAVGLLLPVALSPAALAVGWRLASPQTDPRITLAMVQATVAFPLVAGTVARMRPRPRPGMLAAARSLGARRFRAWRVLRWPSYVIALLSGFLIAFSLASAETSAATISRVPGGTLPVRLLELDAANLGGEAAALSTVILVISVVAFTLGDPIIARLGRARR